MARGTERITVSVINLKGGVGKSTIAALLGRYASKHGLKVLAIDLDPQANLSQAFMTHSYRQFLEDRSPSIVEIFEGYRSPSGGAGLPRPIGVSDVVVGNTPLGGPNLQLIPSRFDFSNHLIDSLKPDPRALARLLSEHFADRDLVLIDCAPTESIFTRAAYAASRYVLVPVKPEYFATIGFPLLQESLDRYRSDHRGHEIDVIGIVINNAFYHGGNDGGPEKSKSLRDIRRDASGNGWHVFGNQIPHSRGFPKVMRGDFRHVGNAYDFREFADEFFGKLGLNLRDISPYSWL